MPLAATAARLHDASITRQENEKNCKSIKSQPESKRGSIVANRTGATRACSQPIRKRLNHDLNSLNETHNRSSSADDTNHVHNRMSGEESKVIMWTKVQQNLVGQPGFCNVHIFTSVLNIAQVDCGGSLAGLVADLGNLYLWHWGVDGTLAKTTVPQLVELPNCQSKIKKISCGRDHMVMLTDDGYLYGIGDNSHGQLGVPSFHQAFNMESIRIKIPGDSKPLCIACGTDYTLVLLENGQILGAGSAQDGVIPKMCKPGELLPIRFNGDEKIKAIAAGNRHALAISSRGDVYSWGCNDHGQLGLGHRHTISYPQLIPNLLGMNAMTIKAASASIVILESGIMYGWGCWGWNAPKLVSPERLIDVVVMDEFLVSLRSDESIWLRRICQDPDDVGEDIEISGNGITQLTGRGSILVGIQKNKDSRNKGKILVSQGRGKSMDELPRISSNINNELKNEKRSTIARQTLDRTRTIDHDRPLRDDLLIERRNSLSDIDQEDILCSSPESFSCKVTSNRNVQAFQHRKPRLVMPSEHDGIGGAFNQDELPSGANTPEFGEERECSTLPSKMANTRAIGTDKPKKVAENVSGIENTVQTDHQNCNQSHCIHTVQCIPGITQGFKFPLDDRFCSIPQKQLTSVLTDLAVKFDDFGKELRKINNDKELGKKDTEINLSGDLAAFFQKMSTTEKFYGKIYSLNRKIQDLEAQVESLKKENSKIERELNDEGVQHHLCLTQLLQKLSQLEGQKNGLDEQINQFKKNEKELMKQRDDLTENIRKLEIESSRAASDWHAQIEATSHKLRVAEDEISKIILTRTNSAALESRCNQLCHTIEENNELIERLRMENESLRSDILKCEEIIKGGQRKNGICIETSTSDIEYAEEAMDKSHNVEEILSQLKQLTKQNEELTSAHIQITEENHILSTRLQDLSTDISRIRQLKSSMEEYKTLYESLMEERKELLEKHEKDKLQIQRLEETVTRPSEPQITNVDMESVMKSSNELEELLEQETSRNEILLQALAHLGIDIDPDIRECLFKLKNMIESQTSDETIEEHGPSLNKNRVESNTSLTTCASKTDIMGGIRKPILSNNRSLDPSLEVVDGGLRFDDKTKGNTSGLLKSKIGTNRKVINAKTGGSLRTRNSNNPNTGVIERSLGNHSNRKRGESIVDVGYTSREESVVARRNVRKADNSVSYEDAITDELIMNQSCLRSDNRVIRDIRSMENESTASRYPTFSPARTSTSRIIRQNSPTISHSIFPESGFRVMQGPPGRTRRGGKNSDNSRGDNSFIEKLQAAIEYPH